MDNYLVYITGLAIITLLIFFILKYKKENKRGQNYLENETNLEVINKNEVSKSKNRSAEVSEIDQLILKNSAGNELVLNRPNELSEQKYHKTVFQKVVK